MGRRAVDRPDDEDAAGIVGLGEHADARIADLAVRKDALEAAPLERAFEDVGELIEGRVVARIEMRVRRVQGREHGVDGVRLLGGRTGRLGLRAKALARRRPVEAVEARIVEAVAHQLPDLIEGGELARGLGSEGASSARAGHAAASAADEATPRKSLRVATCPLRLQNSWSADVRKDRGSFVSERRANRDEKAPFPFSSLPGKATGRRPMRMGCGRLVDVAPAFGAGRAGVQDLGTRFRGQPWRPTATSGSTSIRRQEEWAAHIAEPTSWRRGL